MASSSHPRNLQTDSSQMDSTTTIWQLFEQTLIEVPCLLDGLDPQDWANLAATQLGALEMVLRCCQCTMQVHPRRPLLYVLARRFTGAYCKGSIEVNGVRVPASDAGALAEALRDVVPPYHAWHEEKQGLSKWVQFVWQLLSAAGDAGGDPLRVTALDAHCDTSQSCPGAVLALRPILAAPAVLKHLQYLSLPRVANESIALLQGSLCELTALRRLDGRGPDSKVFRQASSLIERGEDDAALAGLISECTTLQELHLTGALFAEEAAETLLRWLAGAGELRHLRLERCTIEPRSVDEWLAAGSALGALEVYEAVGCLSQWLWERAWRGMTNLQELVLDGCSLDDELATAIADLLRTSTRLRRLEVSGSTHGTDPVQGVVGVLWALQENATVMTFRVAFSPFFLDPLMTEALAAVLRSNVTLKHLDVEAEDSEIIFPPDAGRLPNAEEVAEGLKDNATLETLRLPGLAEECDAARLGAGLARCRSLRHVALGSAHFDESGWLALGRELARSTSLESLETKGANMPGLANGLWRSGDQRSRLRRLSMRSDIIHFAAGVPEVLVSERCTLIELDLRGLGLRVEHCTPLHIWGLTLTEQLIPSTSLLTLRLGIMMSETKKDNEDFEYIALPMLRALRRNKTLRLLDLHVDMRPKMKLTPETEAALKPVQDRVRITQVGGRERRGRLTTAHVVH